MSKPTIYCYNFSPVRCLEFKNICNAIGIVMTNVEIQHQNTLISDLVSGNARNTSGNCFADEMILFVGFDSDTLGKFYSKMNETGIKPVKYKSLLTEFNSKLTSLQLHSQLKFEIK